MRSGDACDTSGQFSDRPLAAELLNWRVTFDVGDKFVSFNLSRKEGFLHVLQLPLVQSSQASRGRIFKFFVSYSLSGIG